MYVSGGVGGLEDSFWPFVSLTPTEGTRSTETLRRRSSKELLWLAFEKGP